MACIIIYSILTSVYSILIEWLSTKTVHTVWMPSGVWLVGDTELLSGLESVTEES